MHEFRLRRSRRGGGTPRRRVSYANVASTVALVIALGGGTAWAAHTYVITSTSQIKPSVLKKLHGKNGTNGTNGTNGANGTNGTKGATGAAGTNATVNGVAAGGDLTGSFPNPSIAPGAITPAKIGPIPTVAVTNSAGEAAHAVVTFDTNLFDPLGMHSTTTNTSRLTAPIAGVYAIDSTVCFSADATGDRALYLQVDGTQISFIQTPAVTGSRATCVYAGSQQKLAAGDYVEVYADYVGATGTPTVVAGGRTPALSMTWVAPG